MADQKIIVDVHTKTGCRVRLIDGGYWPALDAEVGGGMMLVLSVDERHAEVFLDSDVAEALAEGLTSG